MDVIPFAPELLGPQVQGLRILMLATCQAGPLVTAGPIYGHTINHMLASSYRQSEVPKVDVTGTDAVVFALTLRHLMEDATGFNIPRSDVVLARLTDDAELDVLVDRCVELMAERVTAVAAVYDRLPLFFMSFPEPSFDPVGVLARPYRRNSVRGFIRRLNEKLAELVDAVPNGHLLETNEMLNYVGRMHLQDDSVHPTLHVAHITDSDVSMDRGRTVPPVPNSEVFDSEKMSFLYGAVLWDTVARALKVLRQAQPVKLIVCDLDDTLWRGIAADESIHASGRTEGWPLGLVEALLYFKSRGGLLAICSKNDEAPTLDQLRRIWRGAITAEDFVSIKINWRPKSENIAEILAETNLLAANTVFIDDNPREIDEVKSRFPDLRCLGGRHYDWRRIILQAPETQVAVVTDESKNRTNLVRALVDRQAQSKGLPRDQWLRSLSLEQQINVLRGTDAPQFERVFELINKTNQFNTNGRRWTLGEMTEFFSGGGVCICTSLKDKTADNGIIGVSLIAGGEIVQSVLSCRVFGLGAEYVMGRFATLIALGQKPIATGRIVDTGKNFACHSWFENIGFQRDGERFVASAACTAPEWIKVSNVDGVAGLSS